MKGQSREQHVACVNPKPAATLGTSHLQFMLLDFTVVAVMQRIFSSIRYCSYFITLEIEPRNIIIDLCVGYHCEQENKLFSASVSISLTKIVGWVHFLPPSSQRQPVPFPVQKEENYSRKKKKSTSVCSWNLRKKRGKKAIIQMEQAFLPFYLMPQSQLGLISKSSTHTIMSQELDWGGGKTNCEEQGKDSCLC